MTAGFRCKNHNSDIVVVTNETFTYQYMGSPSVQTAGSIQLAPGGNRERLMPYVFHVALSASQPPIIYLDVASDKVVEVAEVYHNGSVWVVTVFSAANNGSAHLKTLTVGGAPVLRVFRPPVQISGSPLRIWRDDVLMADFGVQPMWVRAIAAFTQGGPWTTPQAYGDDGGGVWGSFTGPALDNFIGNQASLSHSVAAWSVLGSAGGYSNAIDDEAEDLDVHGSGWTTNGTHLQRKMMWREALRPYAGVDTLASSTYGWHAVSALIIDRTGL